jgi:DnaJ-class molecular chaperone
MLTSTHHEILGIPNDANAGRVKQAYRSLVKAFHPDMFPLGSEAQIEAGRRIREINVAYSVLSHPHKRADYDATLAKRNSELAPSHCVRCGKLTLYWHKENSTALCKACGGSGMRKD